MIILYFSLVFLCVNAVQVEVQGDISFDLKFGDRIYNGKDERAKETEAQETTTQKTEGAREMKANIGRDGSSDEREVDKKKQEEVKNDRLAMVTKAAPLECVYQYPEDSQVEAMLSNMMNQLAKVYVRVQDYVTGDARRASARFRVVNTKNHTFFDEIYGNMTQEYRKVYNNTALWIPRTNDPCDMQPELKSVWSHLIDSSIYHLRQAAINSVIYFMENKAISLRKRSIVDELVEKELARVRAAQLNTLCDNFQLCFDELMSKDSSDNEEHTSKTTTIQLAYYRH